MSGRLFLFFAYNHTMPNVTPDSAEEKVGNGLAAQVVLAPDPSQNVKDALQAAIDRFDALRSGDNRTIDALRESDLRTVNALRAADASIIDAKIASIQEQMALRAFFTEKLEVAEAKRIDAIRLVDTNAVAIANQRAIEQAAVLANQVSASAETLRILVSQTAAAAKGQLDQTTQQLSDRIAVVERSQYENRGSAGNIPPAITEQFASLAVQVSALKESQDRGEGKQGISQTMLIAIAVAITSIVTFILQRMIMGGL